MSDAGEAHVEAAVACDAVKAHVEAAAADGEGDARTEAAQVYVWKGLRWCRSFRRRDAVASNAHVTVKSWPDVGNSTGCREDTQVFSIKFLRNCRDLSSSNGLKLAFSIKHGMRK